MRTYQLQPARSGTMWWWLLGATAVALFIPIIISAFLPAVTYEDEQVTLGYDEWEITLGQRCPWVESTMDDAWDCPGVTIMGRQTETTDDPEHALFRVARDATYAAWDPSSTLVEDGPGRLLINPEYPEVAMSFQGSGATSGEQMFVVLMGTPSSMAETADEVWQAYGLGPLDEEIYAEIREGAGQDHFDLRDFLPADILEV